MGDSRFAALSSDPRYRIPNRKKSRTAVDSRFKGLFCDEDFRKKASVDRYGRKIKSESGKKELEARFQLEEDDEEDDKEEDEELIDPNEKGKGRARAKVPKQSTVSASEDDDSDDAEDDDEGATTLRRDPAREGGFSDSSSSEEDSEDESDDEAELAEETAGQEQSEEIPMGEVSRRIAAVNLDWDNIRAADIMAVAASFAPKGGRVERVTIYPSEFGRERLEREEIEGPPREIFATGKQKAQEEENEGDDEDLDDSEDDERIKKQLLEAQAGDGEEYDTAKLRQYQLERLRYYYAVVECDSATTAKALYDSMDGREYLSTANFFDLRFIPDETSFDDDKPHEECDSLPMGYKPNDFKTEALTHSKVRLTWDDDDATRKEVQRRAFSRAEMDEEDLKAYIGSDSSDADSVTSRNPSAEDRKAKKREAQREKMRAALGLAAEPSKSKKDKDEPVGDMQITFTSGLGGGKDGRSVFENEPQDEESTKARYIRKERERKQRRKEKMKASRDDAPGDADEVENEADAGADAEADPFDDPFFNDPTLASKTEAAAKKAERRKKREAQEIKDQEAEARKAELDLLMTEDQKDNLRHFDMREIKKAEKDAKRKGKKGKKRHNGDAPVGDDFEVETEDPRFKKLFESHEYAIDPTNPLYQGTKGMRDTLEEARKKRKAGLGLEDDEAEEERRHKKQGKKARRARV